MAIPPTSANTTTCVICFDEVDSTATEIKATVLPCNHAFHEACITPWLQQCAQRNADVTCPLCRRTVTPKNPCLDTTSIAPPIPFNINNFLDTIPPSNIAQPATQYMPITDTQSFRNASISVMTAGIVGIAASIIPFARAIAAFTGTIRQTSQILRHAEFYAELQTRQQNELTTTLAFLALLAPRIAQNSSRARAPLPITFSAATQVEQEVEVVRETEQEVQQQRPQPQRTARQFFESLYNADREIFHRHQMGVDMGGRYRDLADSEVAMQFLDFVQEKNLPILGVTYFVTLRDTVFGPYFKKSMSEPPIHLETSNVSQELQRLGYGPGNVWQIIPSAEVLIERRLDVMITDNAIFRNLNSRCIHRIQGLNRMHVVVDEADLELNPLHEVNYPRLSENRSNAEGGMSATPWGSNSLFAPEPSDDDLYGPVVDEAD